MKTLNLDLKLRFSDKIVTDEDIKTIIENVAQAIQDKSNNDSITPMEIDWLIKCNKFI